MAKKITDPDLLAVEETRETAKEAELAQVNDSYDKFMAKLAKNNLWGIDKKGQLALQSAMQMRSTKIGLYARIPIYCKEDSCPYAESCILLRNNLAPGGQPCPQELAQIQQKYYQYAEEFDLGGEESSFTDDALVEEIITMEVLMERCKALMSKEISPVQMIIAGVSNEGEEYSQPEVSKAAEAYEKFSKKRNENFSLLMATRKDKSKFKKDEREQKTIQDVLDQISSINDVYEIEQRPEGADEIINSARLKKKKG